jgi:hypothetical protein
MTPPDSMRGNAVPLPQPTFAPDTGSGHSPLSATKLSDPARGMMNSAAELGGGHGKALVENETAVDLGDKLTC